MINLKEACSKVVNENGYLGMVFENDSEYSFLRCNGMGELIGSLPVSVNKETGDVSYKEFSSKLGKCLDIPVEYLPYNKVLLKEIIENNKKDKLEVDTTTANFCMNLISNCGDSFNESELYAVVNKLIKLVLESKKNLEDTTPLITRDCVQAFLAQPKEIKLLESENSYWIPWYIRNYIKVAEDISDIALKVYHGEELDLDVYIKAKNQILTDTDDTIKKLSKEDYRFHNKTYLYQKINIIYNEAMKDINFCDGIGSELSNSTYSKVFSNGTGINIPENIKGAYIDDFYGNSYKNLKNIRPSVTKEELAKNIRDFRKGLSNGLKVIGGNAAKVSNEVKKTIKDISKAQRGMEKHINEEFSTDVNLRESKLILDEACLIALNTAKASYFTKVLDTEYEFGFSIADDEGNPKDLYIMLNKMYDTIRVVSRTEFDKISTYTTIETPDKFKVAKDNSDTLNKVDSQVNVNNDDQ